jgi:flagellar motility protein MotE (MotC chaperone)
MARQATRARRPGRGVLTTVALLLIGSAALRLAVDTGPALAREIAAPEIHARALPPATSAPDAARLQSMLDAFRARDAELAAREVEIADRMQALAVVEDRVEAQLAELVIAEEALRATLALADGAAEGDLTRLTAVYEAMKPKEAAALFEQMDPDFAAGFLSRMRPDLAGDIMTGLSPTAAYSISVVLAGRNASVPKN